MSMDMDMLAAPKKIVDGLTEVFQGFAQMFEGVSEQLALLAASAAEEDKELLPVSTMPPPDKPLPADVSAKGVTVPRPRKKPVKRQKAPDAEPVSDNTSEEAPDPAEGDAQVEGATTEEAAEDIEDNSLPAKRSNNEKIGQLLKAYGVGALSDLPAEKYEAFLTDISQL